MLRAPGLGRIVPNLERVKTLADETPQRLGIDAVPGQRRTVEEDVDRAAAAIHATRKRSTIPKSTATAA